MVIIMMSRINHFDHDHGDDDDDVDDDDDRWR